MKHDVTELALHSTRMSNVTIRKLVLNAEEIDIETEAVYLAINSNINQYHINVARTLETATLLKSLLFSKVCTETWVVFINYIDGYPE